MRAVVALALREARAWRGLAWAALALSALAFSAPWWPGMGKVDAADARGAMATVVAAVLVVGSALVIGPTLLGRDLRERRLGFYLTLPVTTWQLWLGKLVGALAVICGAGLIVVAPSYLVSGIPDAAFPDWAMARGGTLTFGPLLPLALALALLLVAHWWGLALRTRSPWLALDLLAIPIALIVPWGVASHLWTMAAPRATAPGLTAFVAIVVATLAIAPAVALARGRVLPAPTHRAQALVMAVGLCLGAAVLLGWQAWLRAGSPHDLRRLASAEAAPAGEWLLLGGELRGRLDYTRTFLFHPGSGAWMALGPESGRHRGELVWFAADGRSALWRPRGGNGEELARVDLSATAPRVTWPGIPAPTRRAGVAYDGQRVAIWERGGLSLHRTADGALLASAPIRRDDRGAPLWLEAGAVRAALLRTTETGRQTMQLASLTAGERRPVTSPAVELPGEASWWRLSPDRSLLLVGGRDAVGRSWASLHGAREGAQRRLLEGVDSAVFLADGRIAALGAAAAGAMPRLLSPAGELVRSLPLLPAPSPATMRLITVGWEWFPGRLLIATAPFDYPSLSLWDAVELDLEEGAWRRLPPDLIPALDSAHRLPLPLSPGSRTFYDWGRRQLVRIDPDSGERTVLLALAGADSDRR